MRDIAVEVVLFKMRTRKYNVREKEEKLCSKEGGGGIKIQIEFFFHPTFALQQFSLSH